jgi:hypothetical protein
MEKIRLLRDRIAKGSELYDEGGHHRTTRLRQSNKKFRIIRSAEDIIPCCGGLSGGTAPKLCISKREKCDQLKHKKNPSELLIPQCLYLSLEGPLLYPLPICRKEAVSGEWFAALSNEYITLTEANTLRKQLANCTRKDGDQLIQSYIETNNTSLEVAQKRLKEEENNIKQKQGKIKENSNEIKGKTVEEKEKEHNTNNGKDNIHTETTKGNKESIGTEEEKVEDNTDETEEMVVEDKDTTPKSMCNDPITAKKNNRGGQLQHLCKSSKKGKNNTINPTPCQGRRNKERSAS